MSEMTKKYISSELKIQIKKLFKNKCFFCDKTTSAFLDSHIHHFIPESIKGETTESNLVNCCMECHQIIHSKPKLTYREIRQEFYNILCTLFDIVPITNGWDDDLFFNHKEDFDMNKIYYALKFLDNRIGMIDNGFVLREYCQINNTKISPQENLALELFLESSPNNFKEAFSIFLKENQKKEGL